MIPVFGYCEHQALKYFNIIYKLPNYCDQLFACTCLKSLKVFITITTKVSQSMESYLGKNLQVFWRKVLRGHYFMARGWNSTPIPQSRDHYLFVFRNCLRKKFSATCSMWLSDLHSPLNIGQKEISFSVKAAEAWIWLLTAYVPRSKRAELCFQVYKCLHGVALSRVVRGRVWLPFIHIIGPTSTCLLLTDLFRAATDASLFMFNLYTMSIKIMVTDFLAYEKNWLVPHRQIP
jgi:hypothetical protein